MSDLEAQQRIVCSADGTRITIREIGSGPTSLVMVHGAISSGAQWLSVAAALAEDCTCYVMDRWGRGRSETPAQYSFDREAEDILAVLEFVGSEAYLLGHSSGAIFALEAAMRASLAGLILYEPPLHGSYGRFAKEILGRISEAAREGRFEDALSIFVAEEIGMPEESLVVLKETAEWESMLEATPQSVQEWEELARVAPTVDRYSTLRVPTLLLAGSETRDHDSFATEDLARILPNVRKVQLEGEGHVANRSAPDQVAEVITAFLATASR